MQPPVPERGDAGGSYDPRLHVEGRGPPLIFVSGMDGTGCLFYRQVPLLAPRFRVATYALRDDAEHMETLVDDLARVVRTVAPDGEPATIVGESFGGTLAMSFALAHPRLVRALVVLNSFPRFRPQVRLHAAIAAVGLVPWGMMGVVRRLTVARLHSRHTHRSEVRYFLEQTKQTTRRGYISRLRILTEYDIRGRLAEIAVPTLFVASDQDRLVPAVAHASYMAERVPRATLRILEGQGHVCLVAPNVYLGVVLREWM
ncbi:MAG: alpha/beta hydrolase [Gemmatimonadota bacterium]|nr:alpha/beta hydrolase [Gemmatimonadota bacterium]